MSKLEVRANLAPYAPPFAVTLVEDNGFGKDVAWFFKEQDAEGYLALSSRAERAEKACAEMRKAIEQVWDDDEMGYIIGGGQPGKECVKCGAFNGAHYDECTQAPLEQALSRAKEVLKDSHG